MPNGTLKPCKSFFKTQGGLERTARLRKKIKVSFDPHKFLAKVGEGKRSYQPTRGIKLFSPKEKSRTRFFTFSKARSSSPSFPNKAKRRSSPF